MTSKPDWARLCFGLGSERRSAWAHVRKPLMSLPLALAGGVNFRIRFTPFPGDVEWPRPREAVTG